MNQYQQSLRLPEQNSVVVVGRLTKDPELRRTSTGKAVCSFDIAISRRIKDLITGEWKDTPPTFVPIVVWGDQAERCGERLNKGFPVYIEGKLHTNKWDGVDGIKKSRLEVVASKIQFLLTIKQPTNNINTVDINTSNVDIKESLDETNTEDIPF
ncbi:MAG: single-stranded DNA-binding protein [Endomicrobium sp.]|jgi:single-strand DNA-binding protein|nr:single-stranded DNA-binding protein [Endomicrobium sp.]